jgi:iron complex transport system substrate-binding protein
VRAAPAVLLGAVLSCAAGSAGAAVDTARRIVSLAPNVTELLFEAGAGAQIVGASAYSDHPAAARRVPRIGDAFRFDYERILALRPDLVVAWESGTPTAAIVRLRTLGTRVVVLPVGSLDDVATAIETLGRLAGTGRIARRAAADFRARLERLRVDYRGRPALRVFIQLDDQPLFTVTDRHLISEIVSLCGGENVFAGLPGLAPAVDLEAVIVRDPQAILYAGYGTDPAGAWRRYTGITAVRRGNVFKIPPDEIARATPRILGGARRICESLDSARAALIGPGT